MTGPPRVLIADDAPTGALVAEVLASDLGAAATPPPATKQTGTRPPAQIR